VNRDTSLIMALNLTVVQLSSVLTRICGTGHKRLNFLTN